MENSMPHNLRKAMESRVYEYDVFGSIIGYTGTQETNNLFTNQEFDQESELYYYNARYYNPKLGRLISRDDANLGHDGDVISKNRYVYVKNNPMKYTDPTGEEEMQVCKVVEEKTWMDKTTDYISKSWDQLWKGNYSDNVTALGTGAQVGTGLLGVDLPGDLRDITYDFQNWEWSWGHTGKTGLDAISVIPVIGVLKYSDEASTLIKGSTKEIKQAEKIIISPSKLKPTEIPDASHVKELEKSIENKGYYSDKPVKYYEYEGDKYIVDGHHRSTAADNLGVDVYAKEVDESYFQQKFGATADDFINKIINFYK